MNDLRVTLVQTNLHWENPQANLDDLADMLFEYKQETDIIILPEMFTTGFTMKPEAFAEPMEGPTMEWLSNQAWAKNAVVTGSFVVAAPDGAYYNRLVWMRPDGTFDFYDKRHLFALAGEHEHYKAGHSRLITEWRGWRVCPLICYDLRFPVWSRNNEHFDLLIYVANWPHRRSHHWRSLLPARAIENQCYVAAVNRIGDDGNELYHQGDSCVIDYAGAQLWHKADMDAIQTVTLSYKDLDTYRTQLPFLADRDKFVLVRKDS